MNETTVLTLNEKLNSGNAQLIDVREYPEFAGGRVAGAKSFPLGELEKRAAAIRAIKR